MKAVAPKKNCNLIKNEAEKVDVQTLESIVIRYHEPFKKRVLFKEVDLSKNKVLKEEENENYFRILLNCHNIQVFL